MFAEKHDPKNLREILSNETEIYNLVNNFKTSHSYNFLIYGSHGTGKSLFCNIQKKNLLMNNSGGNFLVIDVMQEENIGGIKKKIKNFVESKLSVDESYKIVIIDNVDHLLSSAQLYLRENLEKGDKGLSFWLLTNSLTKINPTILSRCLVVNFKQHSSNNLFIRIHEINIKENFTFYFEAIPNSLIFCGGDTRKAINSFYQKGILIKNSLFPSITHKKLFSDFLSKKIKESNQKDKHNVFLLKMETIFSKGVLNESEIEEKFYISSAYTVILESFQEVFNSMNMGKNNLSKNFFFFLCLSRKKFYFRNKRFFK